LPSFGTTPENEELKEMIWDTIEETLSEMPVEQRRVFIENEFEDLSFKEISERTGVPVNTLISRKRYTVLALRKNLNELYKLLKNN
jgi:RNA polymerase sigma factor (sigma-70 family)